MAFEGRRDQIGVQPIFRSIFDISEPTLCLPGSDEKLRVIQHQPQHIAPSVARLPNIATWIS